MKLTPTQTTILLAAASHPDRIALPLPGNLRGGAVNMIVKAMLKNGLLEEVDADPRRGESVWRETGDGHGVTLVATDAGLAAVGQKPQEAKTNRQGTKQAAMIEMLRRSEGATVDEIAAATGWQKHTIRGAMAGALKKKLGLTITSDKIEARGRVYKIAA